MTHAKNRHWERVDRAEGVWICRKFFDHGESSALVDHLIAGVPWRQDKINLYGKTHDLPRLQQWYGDPNRVYTWSGITMIPLSWPPDLLKIRDRVQAATGRRFNSVLMNYYRNGNDCVSWHSDDERGLGPLPFIASLSVGADRDFLLRRKGADEVVKVSLEGGSLLVMTEGIQETWQHSLPRRKRVMGPRVNLTFRLFAGDQQ